METFREHGRPRQDQRVTVPGAAVRLLAAEFDRTSLGGLRNEVASCAGAHGLRGQALFNFVLAINEITTNAVRHGGGGGRLRLWHDGGDLWCEVSDDGPGLPARYLNASAPRRTDRLGGHGLWLSRHICAALQIDSGRRDGTRVLMRYPLSGDRPAS